MEKTFLTENILRLAKETKGNDGYFVPEPLVGFADASDGLFAEYKRPEAIGSFHRTPEEWLTGAKTVVSLFFPFSREVKDSNAAAEKTETSDLWLHARIEGQAYLGAFSAALRDWLRGEGLRAVAPCVDDSLVIVIEENRSTWSERHAAYAAGLGTFGLSKGLITEKGVAGRFTSIITDGYFAPTVRQYTGLYDYCIRCGACMRNCPAGAIDMQEKHHGPCAEYLHETGIRYAPRYGCGKCQVGVPCESGRPGRRDV